MEKTTSFSKKRLLKAIFISVITLVLIQTSLSASLLSSTESYKIYLDPPVNSPPNVPPAPSGPTNLVVDVSGSYTTQTTDPDGDSIKYQFDWDASDSHDYSSWSDYVQSGSPVTMQHSWSSPGSYVVKSRAQDDYPGNDPCDWSPGLTVTVTSNPPNTPSTPTGPVTGNRNIEYSYSTSTTDPNGDNIYYLFDWDDGSSPVWYGPYNSGQICTQSHEWTDLGSYDVKVKAKDQYNEESGWSNPLIVTINNIPPDSEPNGPYSGEEGETILFDGSGSSDSDGSIASYEWSYTIGPSLPVSMGIGEYLDYVFDEAGDYVITLTVTDNDNGIDYDTTAATIESGMIVNHHGPYNGYVGEQIQFQASAEDGEPPYSWFWDFGDDTYSNEQNPVHVYDTVDVFYVFLYVTDGSGADRTAHTTATIEPAPLTVDINGPYYGSVNEDIQFSSTVNGGTPPYEYLWTFGDNCSSNEENPTHRYTLEKTYDVTLIVTDSMMTSASNSTTAIILQELNIPPNKPELYGPTKGKPGILYTYFVNTTDPNGDQVSYAFDWGIEDQILVWQGPYDSGVTINSSITWSEEGKYTVRVKARDTYKQESQWSDPIEVSMPKNYMFNPWHWLYNIIIKYFPILDYFFL